MDGPDRMTVLAQALDRRGYLASDIDKIVGGNFVRIFSNATTNA
jgi:microsomal dipeptidase-like Zn-dependent dipeptidase